MKIVHLSCVAPPQTGGIGRVAFEEVSRLRERGFDAEVYAPQVGELKSGGGVERLKSWWNYGNTSVPNLFELEKVVRGADIVHLHYPHYGTSEFLVLLKWLKKVKRLVMTLHMDASHPGAKGFVLNVHRALNQPIELASANILLCSSKDYIASSSFKKYVNDPRLIELPFGIDEERFKPGVVSRTAYGIPPEASVIGFVGGMDQAHNFKGVDVLLQAFSELPANTWLVLAGDGDLRPSFERKSAQLQIQDRVRFLGRVSEEELPNIYRLADVFAFPSTSGAEAFGLVALEAQATGVPVVASDLPGVRTVVQDKQTGFLTPPGNAPELAAHLRLLIENREVSEYFGRAARDLVVQKFTWSTHMDQLAKVYQNLCG